MSFVSLRFFVIVVSTIVLYFIIPLKKRWLVLLAASCLFYYESTGTEASLIIFFTAAATYFSALSIGKINNQRRKAKLIFSITIVAVLSVLILTKIKKYVSILSGLVIPMGISYYSFSLIGYLADVYTGKQKPEKNFLKFLLYTTFFLKILQGPISKFRVIGPKLIEGHPFTYQNLCSGIQLVIWGYFKKLVITERTLFVSNLFNDLYNFDLGGFSLLFASTLWIIGFYCDFSGYMDIVTGISQIMGIELDKNFDRPFFSRSYSEFWQRWHITLGIWLRDYIYIPLGGNRKGTFRKYINIIIVFAISGIWHGNGSGFAIWGLYCGLIMVISEIFTPVFIRLNKKLKIKTDSADWHLFQIIRTFFLFMIGILIATQINIHDLRVYFRLIVKDFGFGKMDINSFTRYGLSGVNFIILTIAVIILWCVERKQSEGSVREFINGLGSLAKWSLYALGIIIVLLVGIYGTGYSTTGFAYAMY